MNNEELKLQKKCVNIFTELKTELERLNVEVIKLGWQQRDALISHVYSGYTKHKELNEKKKIME